MTKSRFSILLLLLLAFNLTVSARFFYWQVVAGEELAVAAQQQRFQFAEVTASRGEIFSSDSYPLVLNKPAFLIYVYLPHLKGTIDSLTDKIVPVLDHEKNSSPAADLKKEIKERLSGKSKWVILRRRINEKTKKEIENLEINGLGFEREDIRDYPEASMAAHLLGFVGRDQSGKPKGYFGLEGFYNQQLSGSPGLLIEEKNVFGKPIISANRVKETMRPGLNLQLYLDRTAQFILADKLKEGLEKYGAKSGWGVIIDSQTGGVLAMASFPNYDPELYFSFDQKLFPNPIAAESFEPGSIFKPFVMATALEQGVVKPETKCTKCSGPVKIGDDKIETWNGQYRPNCTMREIIQYSDNVGMVFVAQELGKSKLLAGIKKFGFGQKTEIDLQEENSLAIRPSNQWYPIDLATLSFGQGIAVTPIQMVQAFNVLANKGRLISPKIVKRIWSNRNSHYYQPEQKNRRVLSQKTTSQMKEMLVNAVENGEAKWAKPKKLIVAGKTGTAQIPIRGHYDKEKTIASFIGFAPADDPKFVMLISLREPSTSPWGSETAAPLWFTIAERLAYYWNLL